jgi:outer membrane biosynthesis protein TonB
MPEYPRYRRDDPGQKGGGVSVVHATISPEGKVVRVEWISGAPAYREPVTDAVRRWTYKPYLLNGRPVWVETTITMDVLMGG